MKIRIEIISNKIKEGIIFTLLILILFCTSGCFYNYVKHPSKYYNYTNKTLSRPNKNEFSDFKITKRANKFRQAGHITYDYIKIGTKLNLPNDSDFYKTLVKEIILKRVKDLKIDSIVVWKFGHYEVIDQLDQKKYFIDGEIHTHKSHTKYVRYFEAGLFSKPNIIILGTYVHLKF